MASGAHRWRLKVAGGSLRGRDVHVGQGRPPSRAGLPRAQVRAPGADRRPSRQSRHRRHSASTSCASHVRRRYTGGTRGQWTVYGCEVPLAYSSLGGISRAQRTRRETGFLPTHPPLIAIAPLIALAAFLLLLLPPHHQHHLLLLPPPWTRGHAILAPTATEI